MDVLSSGLQSHGEHHRASQAIRHRGLPARNPDRVAHQDRIGSEIRDIVLYKMLEVRASDLFFKLPDKIDVERNRVLYGCADTHQRSQRGSFIIGSAASFISIILLEECERLAPPLCTI